MGTPIICPRCSHPNGLLVEECRCGEVLTLDGTCTRIPRTPILSASWETEAVPQLWRMAPTVPEELTPLDAHIFLKYCLLLRAIGDKFQSEDADTWFDDCLFFLRGGYNLFSFLKWKAAQTSIQNVDRSPIARGYCAWSI